MADGESEEPKARGAREAPPANRAPGVREAPPAGENPLDSSYSLYSAADESMSPPRPDGESSAWPRAADGAADPSRKSRDSDG